METNGWLIGGLGLAIVAVLCLPGWLSLVRQKDTAAYARSVESTLTSQQARWEGLARRVDEQDIKLLAAEEEIAALKEERVELRGEIADLLHGVEKLIEQLETAGMEPVWRPKAKARGARGARQLARRIAEGFSAEEMKTLAFELDLGSESFGGETAEGRARALVELATRRGKLGELAKRVGEE